jgi:hypothetical protein
MLQEGREVASYLCNIEEESECHTIASWWLNVFRTGLDIFGERLTFDDALAQDEATQAGAGAGSSRAIDEPGSSSRRR